MREKKNKTVSPRSFLHSYILIRQSQWIPILEKPPWQPSIGSLQSHGPSEDPSDMSAVVISGPAGESVPAFLCHVICLSPQLLKRRGLFRMLKKVARLDR